jgi:hypothetical protein
VAKRQDVTHLREGAGPAILAAVRNVTAAALLIVLACAAPHAQAANAADLPLPQGPDAWTARVVISGGITGRGGGEITADSGGRLACLPPLRCAETINRPALDAVRARVIEIRGLQWTRPNPTAVCSDCYTTTFTIHTRAKDGSDMMNVYSWSDIDFASVPDAIKRAYRTVVDLGTRDPW